MNGHITAVIRINAERQSIKLPFSIGTCTNIIIFITFTISIALFTMKDQKRFTKYLI